MSEDMEEDMEGGWSVIVNILTHAILLCISEVVYVLGSVFAASTCWLQIS